MCAMMMMILNGSPALHGEREREREGKRERKCVLCKLQQKLPLSSRRTYVNSFPRHPSLFLSRSEKLRRKDKSVSRARSSWCLRERMNCSINFDTLLARSHALSLSGHTRSSHCHPSCVHVPHGSSLSESSRVNLPLY